MKKYAYVIALAAGILAAISLAHAEETSALQQGVDAVKDAGKTVGHAARDTTRKIGHATRDAATAVGHTTRDVTRDIGHATRDTARNVGHAAGDTAEKIKQDVTSDK